MADTTIRVSTQTRDRLATLAREQDTTIRDLIDDMAGTRPTREETNARHAAARAYIKQHFNPDITDTELDRGPQLLADIAAGRVTTIG